MKWMPSLLLLAAPTVCEAQDVGMMEMRSMNMAVSPEGFDLPNDADTRHKLWVFSQCLAARSGWSNLSELPESGLDRRSLFGMGANPEHCGPHVDWAEKAPMYMRGAYAEYSLTRDFDLRSGKAKRKLQEVFTIPPPEKQASLTLVQKSVLSFIEYGKCVAKVDMPGVARLFAAQAGTPAEKDAFDALGPALGQCLAPGATLKVNRFKLRGYLAEGAYRKLAEEAHQQ